MYSFQFLIFAKYNLEIGEDKKTVEYTYDVNSESTGITNLLKDLKEADVIEWAKANRPVEHMQEVIQKQLEEQDIPKNVEVMDLPWVPADEEAPAEEE